MTWGKLIGFCGTLFGSGPRTSILAVRNTSVCSLMNTFAFWALWEVRCGSTDGRFQRAF